MIKKEKVNDIKVIVCDLMINLIFIKLALYFFFLSVLIFLESEEKKYIYKYIILIWL